MYVGALIYLDPIISARRSARAVFEYAKTHGVESIGIFRQSPHSAHFYKTMDQFRSIKIASSLTVQEAREQRLPILAVKKNDLDKIDPEDQSALSLLERQGEWVFFSVKG